MQRKQVKPPKPRALTAWRVIALLLYRHPGAASVARLACAAVTALAGLPPPPPLPGASDDLRVAAEESSASAAAGTAARHADLAKSGAHARGAAGRLPTRRAAAAAGSSGDEEGGTDKRGQDELALQPFVSEVAVLVLGEGADAAEQPIVAEAAERALYLVAAASTLPAFPAALRAQQPAAIDALESLLLSHGSHLSRKLPAAVLRAVARVCELIPSAPSAHAKKR